MTHMRLGFVAIAVLGIALVGSAGFAADTSTTNLRVPIAVPFFVPCADGGNGEIVDLSGTLHILVHTTTHPDGSVSIVSHVQPQGVKGVGQTTGDIYKGTGVTQTISTTKAGGLPATSQIVCDFRLIGPGTGNNLLIHDTVHTTVNANGVVTASVEIESVDCK
jgi:hypothetical protein